MSLYLIGNSLTNDSIPQFLLNVATQNGVGLDIGFHVRSAQSQTFIQANPSDSSFTQLGNWGVALPAHEFSAISFEPYHTASTLASEANAIRSMYDAAAGEPLLYLYEAWPQQLAWGSSYQTWWDATVVNADATPFTERRQSNDHVRSRLQTLLPSATVLVIPVGSVLREIDVRARAGQLPGISTLTDLYRDEDHMGDVGSYAAAVTVVATLLRKQITTTDMIRAKYRRGLGSLTLTNERAALIESLVWDVVSNDSRTGVT